MGQRTHGWVQYFMMYLCSDGSCGIIKCISEHCSMLVQSSPFSNITVKFKREELLRCRSGFSCFWPKSTEKVSTKLQKAKSTLSHVQFEFCLKISQRTRVPADVGTTKSFWPQGGQLTISTSLHICSLGGNTHPFPSCFPLEVWLNPLRFRKLLGIVPHRRGVMCYWNSNSSVIYSSLLTDGYTYEDQTW